MEPSDTLATPVEEKILQESEELQSQIVDLRAQIEEMKSFLTTRDDKISSLNREKELLSSNLQTQEQYSKHLKEQLDDERYFYQKEKEYFCREMSNKASKASEKVLVSAASVMHCTDPDHEKACKLVKQYEDEIRSLKKELEMLDNELAQRAEVVYNLCVKFLRMKNTKDEVAAQLESIEDEYLKVMGEMMSRLDEARHEVNLIVNKKFEQPMHPNNAIFLQVLQHNNRLTFENSQLRLQLREATRRKVRMDATRSKTDQYGGYRGPTSRSYCNTHTGGQRSALPNSSRRADSSNASRNDEKEVYRDDSQNSARCSEEDSILRSVSAPQVFQTVDFNSSEDKNHSLCSVTAEPTH